MRARRRRRGAEGRWALLGRHDGRWGRLPEPLSAALSVETNHWFGSARATLKLVELPLKTRSFSRSFASLLDDLQKSGADPFRQICSLVIMLNVS